MFNEFCPLKLLQVADIRYASVVVILKRRKCLDRYFEDENDLRVVKVEFDAFSGGRFPSSDVLTDR